MHGALVFSKGWKWKREVFGEQVDALGDGAKSRPKRDA